jgi:hypothetical protein
MRWVGVCGTHKKMRNLFKILIRKLQGTDLFGDLGINSTVILIWSRAVRHKGIF